MLSKEAKERKRRKLQLERVSWKKRFLTEKPSIKRCLKCDTPFKSKGVHNRMCPICKEENSQESDDDLIYIESPYTRVGKPRSGSEHTVITVW